MESECKLVSFLKALKNSSEEKGAVGLALVAASALNIIDDINQEFMSDRDIACLADLIVEMRNEGHPDLLAYLVDDEPDCAICGAIAKHLRRHAVRPQIPT